MEIILRATGPIIHSHIDYITVRTPNGREIDLNWEFSDYEFYADHMTARFDNVCFNEESGEGRLHELVGMKIANMQLYDVENDKEYFDSNFVITEITITDAASNPASLHFTENIHIQNQ